MSEYKLVPVEPTEEMVRAGYDARFEKASTNRIYAAMLSAAPDAPAVQAEPVARFIFNNGRITGPYFAVAKLLDLPNGEHSLYLPPPAATPDPLAEKLAEALRVLVYTLGENSDWSNWTTICVDPIDQQIILAALADYDKMKGGV